MLKLNLACGPVYWEGWKNLDVVKQWPGARACDIVWDARTDKIPFEDGTVDEVYAGYLFLHLAPQYHRQVAEEIHRVIRKKGLVRISEVEMSIVVKRWLENPKDESYGALIWGEQGTLFRPPGWEEYEEFDKHCWGFTESTLRDLMASVGFKRITRVRIHTNCYYELTLDCRK